MTTSGGRKVVSYLVKCALAANDTLTKQDQNGNWYTFAGGMGLCPAWKNGDVHTSAQCMEGISACLMAHVNTAGVHVPLWLDSNMPSIGWGVDRTNYPMQEGTFFGDILDTGYLSNIGKPTVSAPVAYYCDGAGYPAGASGVVAGRIGANQTGAPYMNPFGNGTLCQNAAGAVGQYSLGMSGSCPAGSTSSPAGGCPDGYKALSSSSASWQYGITVWRNNNYTPQFDTGYQYALLTALAPSMAVDTSSSAATLYSASANLASSLFSMSQVGSNWKLSPITNPALCLDAGAAIDNTPLAAVACSSSTSQQFSITPDPMTGTFFLRASNTGRCLWVKNGSIATGTPIVTYDCVSGSVGQKFVIQAR